jgi:hypothetical protein
VVVVGGWGRHRDVNDRARFVGCTLIKEGCRGSFFMVVGRRTATGYGGGDAYPMEMDRFCKSELLYMYKRLDKFQKGILKFQNI